MPTHFQLRESAYIGTSDWRDTNERESTRGHLLVKSGLNPNRLSKNLLVIIFCILVYFSIDTTKGASSAERTTPNII